MVAALGFAALKVWKSPRQTIRFLSSCMATFFSWKRANQSKCVGCLIKKNGLVHTSWRNFGKFHCGVYLLTSYRSDDRSGCSFCIAVAQAAVKARKMSTLPESWIFWKQRRSPVWWARVSEPVWLLQQDLRLLGARITDWKDKWYSIFFRLNYFSKSGC